MAKKRSKPIRKYTKRSPKWSTKVSSPAAKKTVRRKRRVKATPVAKAQSTLKVTLDIAADGASKTSIERS